YLRFFSVYRSGEGKFKTGRSNLHFADIEGRSLAGVTDALDSFRPRPAMHDLPGVKTAIRAEYKPVITHSQSVFIQKRYTGTLEFTVDFFQHHPHNPVMIHFPDEPLTFELGKLSAFPDIDRFSR